MKSTLIKYTLVIGFVLFLIACSVKKDRFINRNFHAVTTEYNVLYNGNIALEKGLESLNTTYQDNFWDILPVERVSVSEEKATKDQTKNQDFEKAEEKAVKAIQKHSMNIGGNEKNPQMDEAYLLLAKARYYDNRFIPSLEALNYILYKYPLSDKIYHAKVWREKVNIRLDNDQVAIKNLKKLLEDKRISGQDLADANAMLTQAYLNIQAKDSAIATIKIAKETTKNNDEKARYSFILGQLYESLNHQDSAFAAYESVIQMNRKSPRRYVIQAQIKQAQQFDYKKGDTLVFVKDYTKLLEDRENRPFLDALHHQFGLFYDKQNDNISAKKQYNKSLKTNSKDKYLVASNYRNIAEIYFRESKYKTAGQYYDSTLVNLNDRTREYRKIKKKRVNLDDVIKYETIAQANDSILSVVALSDLGRKSYYEEYIKKLKIEDETKAKLAAIQAEKEANLAASNSASGGSLIKSDKNNLSDVMKNPVPKPAPGFADIGGDKNSGFYFYNQVTVAYGKKEFANKWGKRALKDNWRWSSASDTDSNTDLDTKDEDVASEKETKDKASTENPKYTTEFYLEQLPSDQKVLDSLAKDRNFAYYQLGIIYKEKFKENELAASRLEQLLKNNPEERLVLPAKYNLYKIYQIIAPAKAEQLKQQIIAEYPNSRYAEIIKNPSVEITDEANPELVYNTLYKKLENNQLREVYTEVDELINRFTGEESVAKFELLKAKAVGRLQGLDEYKKGLNYVALTYPNIEEGKQAESLLATDIPKLEALTFAKEDVTEWKLIFPKKFPLDKEVKNLTDKIEKYLNDSKTASLKYSNDIYTMTDNFIVIHGFGSKESANAVLSVLKEHKNYKIKDQAYLVSTEDYKIIQMQKKFGEWLLLNK
ncbi:MAG: gliding motility protein [Flavobacterium sp.]|nr:gliding motility protein [Flavobacterium sp.]